MKKINLGRIATKATEGKLYSCSSVWPFKMFPDTVILEEDKLTHIHREFFGIKDVKTLQISEISSVEVTSGPIFATATVYSKYMTTGEYVVNWLYTKDAQRLRELAHELMASGSSLDQSGGQ